MRIYLICIFLLMSLSHVGCSNSGTPLAGDQAISSKCPPGGCAGTEADSTQLSISSPAGTTIYVPRLAPSGVVIDPIEIGGDCFTSTYASNRIEVEVYQGSNRVIVLPTDITNTRRNYAIATENNDRVPRCHLGRYGFTINGAVMPNMLQYNVKVNIVGINEQGNEFRNEGSGVFRLNVARQ
jgi:hypothetical protein